MPYCSLSASGFSAGLVLGWDAVCEGEDNMVQSCKTCSWSIQLHEGEREGLEFDANREPSIKHKGIVHYKILITSHLLGTFVIFISFNF